MDLDPLAPPHQAALRAALGYLNYSSGVPDPSFRRNINELFAAVEQTAVDPTGGEATTTAPDGGCDPSRVSGAPAWQALANLLKAGLATLAHQSDSFRQPGQAEAVLALVFDHTLPAYRRFHRDLLSHQTDESLFRPFFVARTCEAVLRQDSPWHETERIVAGALSELNDFIGHRPVAVLHSRKIEPYMHEWVCPIPFYFRDAGVAAGRYHDIVRRAVEILHQTDREILDEACFDLALLDELALDPRAYDFDHPANKRPNYQFGQWDPHQIDNAGRYRRFVVTEVTLEALHQRYEQAADGAAADELLLEAAAVLACAILMASGVSGRGPDTHDSSTTLATLVPRIAAYRDAFYQRLLERLSGDHGQRLRDEAHRLRQPFAKARQDLNSHLTRQRAAQLQHVHLSRLFARMGCLEASARHAEVVAVARARMLCQISGRITAGQLQLVRGAVAATAVELNEVVDLIHRAIECGALVDPWNILGFQGQFSLFPALENSVADHRVSELVDVVAAVFNLYVRSLGEAAAGGHDRLRRELAAGLEKFAAWWDRFATSDVSGVERVSGREVVEAARAAADALAAWQKAGAPEGNVAFWQDHVEGFQSPRAYSVIVRTLLDRGDFAISIALLVAWLEQAETLSLGEGQDSFGSLVLRWLAKLHADVAVASPRNRLSLSRLRRFHMAAKCLDYLEANAGSFWQMPSLFDQPNESQPRLEGDENDQALADDDRDDDGLFAAAYEGVTYRDSTADGVQRDTLDESGPASEYELDHEARRLAVRLEFHSTVARLWQRAALLSVDPIDANDTPTTNGDDGPRTDGDDVSRQLPEPRESLRSWLRQAGENRRRLLALLSAVHSFQLPTPTSAPESLVEYDRRRAVRDALAVRVVAVYVETAAAEQMIVAAAGEGTMSGEASDWEAPAAALRAALWRGDVDAARSLFPALLTKLARQRVLYVPLAKGGDPRRLAAAQSLLLALSEMLSLLPRRGLLSETCQLLHAIAAAEKQKPGGESVISEFDRLFQIGYQGIAACLAESAAAWEAAADGERSYDAELFDCLQAISDPLLKLWLAHSRLIRLSSLEKLADDKRWEALVQFIQRYGHDLFTPKFLNLGRLRTLLSRGADNYLRALEEDDDHPPRLVEDLDRAIARGEAAELLGLAVEAVAENYAEYRDYNTTTTQSDRGELLYILLDFLRLKASYQRFAWTIRPVVMAHDVLVRHGRTSAAELWRRAVAQRTAEAADWHLKRLAELQSKHGMRLATVSSRLGERFVQPLAEDRLRAFIRPVVEEVRLGRPPRAVTLLEQELAEFVERIGGSGLEVPRWLAALEHEAELALSQTGAGNAGGDVLLGVPQAVLALAEVERQLKSLDQDA